MDALLSSTVEPYVARVAPWVVEVAAEEVAAMAPDRATMTRLGLLLVEVVSWLASNESRP